MATAPEAEVKRERPLPTFKATDKQREANRLLFSGVPNVLLAGGSRSGKTFIEVRALVTRALRAPGSRQAIWRQHFNHAKASIGMDTFPKVMKLCWPDLAFLEFNHEGIVQFPGGSEIWLAGLDDKERVEKILGQEFCGNLFNECSTISYHAVETAKSRLAQKVMVTLDHQLKPLPKDEHFQLPLISLYDMNPAGHRHWTYQTFVKKLKYGTIEPLEYPEDYAWLLMNPDDNRENLPEAYFRTLASFSEAKRRRFKEGKWASDLEGALWKEAMLENARVAGPHAGRDEFEQAIEPLNRVVVGVDPSGAKTPNGEEVKNNAIGIVACGRGMSTGKGYILEDGTITAGPGEWGARVVELVDRWQADRVIAEPNFGGAMVEFVLLSARSTLPVKMVTSSRGKALRAEPIAALYEANHQTIKHAGHFPELEDQMAAMLPQPNGYTGEGSPDRLDAAVFALTELMLGSNYNLNNLD